MTISFLTRKGSLDIDLLKKMGLKKKVMERKDCLFFYQLILPMCNVSKSGIEDDPRQSYYSMVENWSNIYALDIELGGSYGHEFNNVMIKELVNFDGVLVKDGVRGGSNGALYRRWQTGSDMEMSILRSMTFRRFLQIKRVIKLCNNSTAKKRGEEGYDPAYKFDYIWATIVHNINAITKEAELDLCGDESSYATASFGEKGLGIVGRIQNKPGVSKGGQIVLVSDVHRICPRAYIHRH